MKISHRLLVGISQHSARPFMLLSFALLLGTSCIATASVLGSKHDLSASGPGPVKATSETQVCVFCHTPHGADQTANAPLWNRVMTTATYTNYISISMNTTPGAPGTSSKVCLSCHDGTLAIGVVGNLNGQRTNIAMSSGTGTGTGGVMPDGYGATTGYTRNLGINLSNDHPISFTYDTTLSGNDGELRDPPVVNGTTTVVGNRSFGVNPTFPLESSQMQCGTCHDPHKSTSKFLRGLRIQQTSAPSGVSYDATKDIMCLACHDKDKAGPTWSNSAHANNDVNVANEEFTDTAADMREFPRGTKVWQASCLNCHDTHTVQGARRLLREGTDASSTLTSPKAGGASAMEETCYQCHSDSSKSVLKQNSPPNTVPDIMSDFLLPTHMPISVNPETHDIGGNFNDSNGSGIADGTTGDCTLGKQCGKDLMESETLLGRGNNLTNRHAECTDCHNPHRSSKNRLFNANTAIPDAAGTHLHNINSGTPVAHSNIASGSLRGSFGVEPVYAGIDSANFVKPGGIPTTFKVKRGDSGISSFSDVGQTYVTREYQVCLKCHSNYAYNTPDLIGNASGGTPRANPLINGFDTYLNTAMEIQAPATHQGVFSPGDSGALSPTYTANNQRSWHPVMDITRRTTVNRGNASQNLWRAPWNGSDSDGGIALVAAVGNQTMYCSDCHGTVTALANGVVPDNNGSAGAWTEDGKPWGPHGSADYFILKGPSDTTTPLNPSAITPLTTTTLDTLCFRCHDQTQYADPAAVPAPAALASGFGAAGNDAASTPVSMANLHQRHAFYTSTAGQTLYPGTVWPIGAVDTYRCTMCHTGTAHGWKNKDFLVNLNDIGPEVNRAVNGTIGGGLGGETSLSASSCNANTTLCAGDPVPQGTKVPAAMAPVQAYPLVSGYTNGPYYRGALLRIANTGFKASGLWTKLDCASAGCH